MECGLIVAPGRPSNEFPQFVKYHVTENGGLGRVLEPIEIPLHKKKERIFLTYKAALSASSVLQKGFWKVSTNTSSTCKATLVFGIKLKAGSGG